MRRGTPHAEDAVAEDAITEDATAELDTALGTTNAPAHSVPPRVRTRLSGGGLLCPGAAADGAGGTAGGGLHALGLRERIRIGAHRELLVREAHHIVRAHRDGTDRFVAVHHGDPGCAPDRMSVHALENCRTGRVRRHHDTGMLVAELLFDTRLRAGDTFLFRHAVEDGTAGVSREYVRGLGVAGGQYALQVRFDDGSLPVRRHRFAQHSAAAPRSGRQDLPVSARHRSVHLVEPRLRPGILGIGWDWE